MMDLGQARHAGVRLLKTAGRLALCLAFLLQPLAAAAVQHHGTGAGVALAAYDDGCGIPETPADDGEPAMKCHHAGAGHAFVAPANPALGRDRVALAAGAAVAAAPPSAIGPRFFRPPRTGLWA